MIIICPLSYHLRPDSVVKETSNDSCKSILDWCSSNLITPSPVTLECTSIYFLWHFERQLQMQSSVMIQYHSHQKVNHSFLAYFLYRVKKGEKVTSSLSTFVCHCLAFVQDNRFSQIYVWTSFVKAQPQSWKFYFLPSV